MSLRLKQGPSAALPFTRRLAFVESDIHSTTNSDTLAWMQLNPHQTRGTILIAPICRACPPCPPLFVLPKGFRHGQQLGLAVNPASSRPPLSPPLLQRRMHASPLIDDLLLCPPVSRGHNQRTALATPAMKTLLINSRPGPKTKQLPREAGGSISPPAMTTTTILVVARGSTA